MNPNTGRGKYGFAMIIFQEMNQKIFYVLPLR